MDLQNSSLLSLWSTLQAEGVPVRFLNINQLIRTEQITNRAKDKIDIEELEKIRKSGI
ncbi:MAG: hypothetical protein JNL57_06745 [Bacteroidetes bacterium]|nr:hypothetical protein [Bacteroidota bacterium]